MLSRLLLPVSLLALTAPLTAQKLAVFPSDHTDFEGTGSNTRWHFANGKNRSQFLYESWDLKIPDGASITKVGFRQDGRSALKGQKVQLEVLMGKSQRSVASSSSTYSTNYDGAAVTVFTKKVLQLPSYPAPVKRPSDKLILVPLDRAYKLDKGKNLIVDYLVHANDKGSLAFNYPLDAASYRSATDSFGTGCGKYNGKTPTARPFPTRVGANWQLGLSNAPGSSAAILFTGFSKKKLLGSIDLPLALDGLGAPGCKLYVDVQLLWATKTSTTGTAALRLAIPNDRVFNDITFYNQWLILDVFANSAGWVTTNGVGTTFGILPAMIQVYGDVARTSGARWASGTVSVFEYK